jgi:hypothetical protein
LQLDLDDCHCHARPCRRAVGKLPPAQKPGRPGKRVRADDPGVSVGLKAADELPRPPILVSIDEIWAMRFDPACPPPPRPLNTLISPLTPCRYVDFENDLEAWQRGEKLLPEPQLEYAVHGHYRMDEGAQNGLYGCWWFELKELVRALSRALVTEKLEEFEGALASEREKAMERVTEEIAEEDALAEAREPEA